MNTDVEVIDLDDETEKKSDIPKRIGIALGLMLGLLIFALLLSAVTAKPSKKQQQVVQEENTQPAPEPANLKGRSFEDELENARRNIQIQEAQGYPKNGTEYKLYDDREIPAGYSRLAGNTEYYDDQYEEELNTAKQALKARSSLVLVKKPSSQIETDNQTPYARTLPSNSRSRDTDGLDLERQRLRSNVQQLRNQLQELEAGN